MTLFILFLVLIWERFFKHSKYWQLDFWLERLFSQLRETSITQTLILVLCWMLLIAFCLQLASSCLYSLPLQLLWIILGVMCIGAGDIRRHYRTYLIAAARENANDNKVISEKLAMTHSLPVEGRPVDRLRELQNNLLWINFRFYLAPIFWLIIGGSWGPVPLAGYTFLRAWQIWLARYSTPIKRKHSGIDLLLNWLDWLPVRIAGAVYVLLRYSDQALVAWFTSLWDINSNQYQVLTRLAQFYLAREPRIDTVQTLRSAVLLAKKVTLVIIVLLVLLNIYGMLF